MSQELAERLRLTAAQAAKAQGDKVTEADVMSSAPEEALRWLASPRRKTK